MGLFRNREIARFARLFGAVSLVGSGLGFWRSPASGILILAVCCILFILWYWDTQQRYKSFAHMAEEIDKILHNPQMHTLSHYQEGELCQLENEITKLLLRLQEQASQLEKDKSALADAMADISHQLRTSLTTIHLALSSMGAPNLSQQQQTSYRQEIGRQLTRMDWLVSSLLKLSKLDAGAIQFKPVPISLEALVAKAVEPLRIPMELKEQTLTVELSGNVLCDPAWTTEALCNILKNCTEHMERGTLYITAQENALYSQIIIRDTGAGIDPNDLPHLFERFYRGKNAAKDSVGIGLALSRSILAAQNGTVKVRNHPKGGAEFTIRFYKSTI